MKQGISQLQSISNTMKRGLFALIFAATCFDLFAQQAQTVFGEVLVQLRPNTTLPSWLREAQNSLGIDAHLEYKSTVSEHMRIHLLSFDEHRVDKQALIRELQHMPFVSCAQANHILAERIIPDDPFFSLQWHHQQANDSDIDSDLAWDITTGGTTANGTDIVVCVVEIGGAQWNTSDIATNHWVNAAEIPSNSVDDDGNGYVDDYHGWNINTQNDAIAAGDHGTRVSSMIGSTGNNSTGVVGVNWNVKMMQVQIGSSTEAAAIAGYEYPLKMRRLFQLTQGEQGAFVVATNSSWGTDNGQPADAPLWCAMYDSLGYYGIISCASTTNNNANVDAVGDLPTACPSQFLISVGRSNSSDVRASGGYGINTIDLVAPGDNVYLANNTQYVSTTGTSFSSPCVAGGVALLYSAPCTSLETQALADPMWTAQQIKNYVLDGVDTTQQLLQETASGGRFNVNNSLQLLLQQCENGSCLQPYNLSIQEDSLNHYTLFWNTIVASPVAELRYRNIAQPNWTIVSSINSNEVSVQISEPCASYEAQVRTLCASDSSAWSPSIYWTTEGCCIAPASISTVETGSSNAWLNWEAVQAATSYDITWANAQGEMVTFNTTEPAALIENLLPCTEYEVHVLSQCADSISNSSASLTIHVGGCDDCTDLTYCPANASSAAEYIALVSLNGFSRSSGSDNGYIHITEPIIDLIADSVYTLTVAPGYVGSAYNENFRAWLDYNADGAFDASNELIFDPASPTQTALSGVFTIPGNATPGIARLRVGMSYTPLSSNVEPQQCGTWTYGEVEDYCVRILDAVGISSSDQKPPIIYPNPARDSFRIARFSGRLTIHDVSGACIYTSYYHPEDIIDTSRLAAGCYFVTLSSKEQSSTRPLIIER